MNVRYKVLMAAVGVVLLLPYALLWHLLVLRSKTPGAVGLFASLPDCTSPPPPQPAQIDIPNPLPNSYPLVTFVCPNQNVTWSGKVPFKIHFMTAECFSRTDYASTLTNPTATTAGGATVTANVGPGSMFWCKYTITVGSASVDPHVIVIGK